MQNLLGKFHWLWIRIAKKRIDRFLLTRHRALEEYFASGVHERFLLEIDDLIERMEHPVRRDPTLQTKLVYERPHEVLARMHLLRQA